MVIEEIKALTYKELQAKVKELHLDIKTFSTKEVLINAITNHFAKRNEVVEQNQTDPFFSDDRPLDSVKITNGRKTIYVPAFNVKTLLKPSGIWELCEGEELPLDAQPPKEPVKTGYTRSGFINVEIQQIRKIYEKLSGVACDIDWDKDTIIDNIIFIQESEKEEIISREDLVS